MNGLFRLLWHWRVAIMEGQLMSLQTNQYHSGSNVWKQSSCQPRGEDSELISGLLGNTFRVHRDSAQDQLTPEKLTVYNWLFLVCEDCFCGIWSEELPWEGYLIRHDTTCIASLATRHWNLRNIHYVWFDDFHHLFICIQCRVKIRFNNKYVIFHNFIS